MSFVWFNYWPIFHKYDGESLTSSSVRASSKILYKKSYWCHFGFPCSNAIPVWRLWHGNSQYSRGPDLAEFTKATSVVTGILSIQWSKCRTASLAALSNQDRLSWHLFIFIIHFMFISILEPLFNPDHVRFNFGCSRDEALEHLHWDQLKGHEGEATTETQKSNSLRVKHKQVRHSWPRGTSCCSCVSYV